MPELPEVETIRRDLAPELEGRTIREVRIRRPDILMNVADPDDFRSIVEGRTIERVDRRAKYLLFRLSGGRVLQVQLRMTGRFALGERPPDASDFSHVAAEFRLDDGRTLYYDDVRRLGGFKLLEAAEWEDAEAELGPEPLAEAFTREALARRLEGRRAPVKNLLLDQRRVAGVGNIYASESLHGAGIDPRRPAGGLDEEEIGALHGALRQVLREALAHAGTTLRDYRGLDGRTGDFQGRLRVYGREDEPCPRCGEAVRRVVQAGRSTYFCPACQD